jgi:pyrroloquinoline quinone biosynthesis protein B
MRIRVLGSAAGGGFPQWNCNCRNCDGVRSGALHAQARTQSSIAVTADSVNWVLFNASPDILQQLKDNPELQPARALRDTGIKAVILIDAQIDHTTGLLMLREGRQPLQLYATDMVHEDLTTGNPLLDILGHYCGVEWHRIGTSDASFTIPGIDGLEFKAMPLKSAAPPYSPHRNDPHPGDNIGVRITDTKTGRSVFYAPGLGEIEPHVEAALREVDCVMVDGTFWTDDEMIRLGISEKRARQIGHLPQSGAGGMIEWMGRFAKPRKVLIHINNTNPILNEDSIEREELAASGIEVAFDGMDIRI